MVHVASFPRRAARVLACAALAASVAIPTARAQFVNDPAGEPASAHQGYPSLARLDGILVAAFTDYRAGTNQRIRCSYSPDSGATWIPLGVPPAPAGAHWVTDPRVVASPVHGRFFVFGGANDYPVTGALFAFVPLTFTAGSPSWGTPGVVRVTQPGNYLTILYGHDAAVSPTTGRLFVASLFNDGVAPIGLDVQFSDDQGQTWSAPVRQDSVGTCPLLRVHGDRVYLMNGQSFPTYLSVALASSPTAWTSRRTPRRNAAMLTGYMPGGFASWFDIDDSGGAHDGRLYAAWSESYEFADDPIPDPELANPVSESEPNETFGSAAPAAVGDVLRGSAATSGTDLDHFRLHLGAGERMIVWADSVAGGTSSLNLVVAESLGTRPAWRASQLQNGVKRTFVAPRADDFDFTFSASFSDGIPRGYRVRTAPGIPGDEPAADACDIVAATTDDFGATWSGPVRASATATGVFDDSPVVEVGPDGRAQVGMWSRPPDGRMLDARWRLMRTNDSGASWQMGGFTTSPSPGLDWSALSGTYMGTNAMLALPDRYVHAFGELQPTSPVNTDIRAAIQRTGFSGIACWGDVTGAPGEVVHPGAVLETFDAYLDEPVLFTPATDRGWALAAREVMVPAGSAATVTFDLEIPDTAAAGDVELQYQVSRLGEQVLTCAVNLHVQSNAGVGGRDAVAFGLGRVAPNPVRRMVTLGYAVPRAERVTLDLLDLHGRRVARLLDGVQEAGAHVATWDGRGQGGWRLPPGVYLLELRAGGLRDARRLVLLD